jgi:hypothetical protein
LRPSRGVLPLISTIIYLIARPSNAERTGLWPGGSHHQHRNYRAADEISKAAQLYVQGRITADEYEHLKSQALAR